MRSILEYFNKLNRNQLVLESIENKKQMYRSGPVQNIKMFNPRNSSKSHNKLFKNKQIIYATDNISYAAGFCFEWSDNEGFVYGRWNNGPWVLEMPKKYKNRLDSKCSMYELENNTFRKFNIKTPEYYSTKPVKVIKEVKFRSCYDCLKKYGVVLKVI
jgi:hypothetical protein